MKVIKQQHLTSDLFQYFKNYPDYDFWNFNSIHDFLSSQHNSLWLLKKDEDITGMAIWSANTEQIELIYIFVIPEARRMNHAKELFQLCLANLTKGLTATTNVFLEVSEKNIKAIQLYKKLGFKISRTRPKYYTDGSDAFEMIFKHAPTRTDQK